ncbi:MAG: hypothetical protein MJZ34_04915 [Paludibacteraceae bacterium]|nr:hypothetical protein [Paludibacteraceae bacterium]
MKILSKKEWKQLNEEELSNYIEEVFQYYRQKGFPYYPSDKEYRRNEYQKFISFNANGLIEGDMIKQTMHGLAFCWSYMPHSFSVECNGLKTPLDIFNSEEFKNVIRKRMMFGDTITDCGIRKMLKIYTGVQCVSNFRPTSAYAIYKRYCNKDSIVWDMSSGYGGRMMGAIKCGIKRYIGCEPCTETYNGLMEMRNDIKSYNKLTRTTDIQIHKIGSEDFIPDEMVDMCFTSPPYFNTEKYSNEDSQSCNRYTTKEEWINDFFGKTIDNCKKVLKKDGILAINIANVKSYKNLEEDAVRVINEKGFQEIETLKYSLSSLSHNDKFKYEPVFVFKN